MQPLACELLRMSVARTYSLSEASEEVDLKFDWDYNRMFGAFASVEFEV
jgi:hypothetical protein